MRKKESTITRYTQYKSIFFIIFAICCNTSQLWNLFTYIFRDSSLLVTELLDMAMELFYLIFVKCVWKFEQKNVVLDINLDVLAIWVCAKCDLGCVKNEENEWKWLKVNLTYYYSLTSQGIFLYLCHTLKQMNHQQYLNIYRQYSYGLLFPWKFFIGCKKKINF